MARPPAVVPAVKLTIALPADIHARLAAYLYSPSEQRIPFGAYQRFFSERITEFFKETPHASTDT